MHPLLRRVREFEPAPPEWRDPFRDVSPQAVILAAGAGSRLRVSESGVPKPLTSVAGVTLLERAIRNCQGAGVTDILVVVGYQSSVLIAALAQLRVKYGIRIRPVINEHWEQGNAGSVLAAEPYIHSAFYLMMCDHVVDQGFLPLLAAADDGQRACALVVDRQPELVPDLWEATKARLIGGQIVAIGKDLLTFDAVDTGVFLCRRPLFEALHEASADGLYGLSDGVRLLAAHDEVAWVDSQSFQWMDVDTPEDLKRAERWLSRVTPFDARSMGRAHASVLQPRAPWDWSSSTSSAAIREEVAG